MRPPDTLFDTAACETDPETSHQAAELARLNKTRDQELVLRIHAQHPFGLTDFELAAFAGRQQTSLGVRRGELRSAGLIDKTEERRPSPSGSPCVVWRITRAGLSTVVASLLAEGDRTGAAAS